MSKFKLNKEIIECHQDYKDILYKHALEIYKDSIDSAETYGEAYKIIKDIEFKVKQEPELVDFLPIYELALVILEQRMRATSIKK
ncbi:hypothetical protein [Staphylococcus debuckii]|uniref:hypothetical protein n=1 Tax=Staphylococcus debuckii TaxID=2044912 RepID=UPI000F43733D|nr:hypothetical protein [Staphylococcus debuckii]AYU54645.1 hypothetical protein CNQ82_04070 [Staphylococcus debuckii]